MDELLKQLEIKIRSLLDRHLHLTNSNQQLLTTHAFTKNEKELLLNKQKQAILQIESLIAKLKTIEKSS